MESNDIDLKLEQSRGSHFWSNGIIFAILQSFKNFPVVKERFPKQDIGKDKTTNFFHKDAEKQ